MRRVTSSDDEIHVVPLTRGHVRSAGRLLASAFDDDPVIGHFMPKGAPRRAVFPGFFRSVIEEALPLGHVCELTGRGRLLGAAVWFPPARSDRQAQTSRRARAALMPAKAVFRSRLSQLLAGFDRLAGYHP